MFDSPFPHKYCANNAFVLVATVDVGSNAAVKDITRQKLKGFLSKRLRRASKVSKFWGIDSCETNMYLSSN